LPGASLDIQLTAAGNAAQMLMGADAFA